MSGAGRAGSHGWAAGQFCTHSVSQRVRDAEASRPAWHVRPIGGPGSRAAPGDPQLRPAGAPATDDPCDPTQAGDWADRPAIASAWPLQLFRAPDTGDSARTSAGRPTARDPTGIRRRRPETSRHPPRDRASLTPDSPSGAAGVNAVCAALTAIGPGAVASEIARRRMCLVKN